MISKTDEERLRYEMRTKAMRDYVSNIEAARDEGEERGLQKGQWIGRIRNLQELLGDAVSKFEELRQWDVERLRNLGDSLQARLRGRP